MSTHPDDSKGRWVPIDPESRGGGVLFVVATPIGNLEDLTVRARGVLGTVDVVLAEDTRHTRRLLAHHAISARLESLHEHNERRRARSLASRAAAGESFALVCDAGTPLVSDPGYLLVRCLIEAEVPVVPIPGPSAFLCALSVAGVPVDRFVFEGFLPASPAARARRLEALSEDPRTLVFHEAPHRVAASLRAMCTAFGGDRAVVIARELTKRYESIVRTTLVAAQAEVSAPRGEYVIVVTGCPPGREIPGEAKRVLTVLLESLPLSQAVDLASRATGVPRSRMYRQALALRKGRSGTQGSGCAAQHGGGH